MSIPSKYYTVWVVDDEHGMRLGIVATLRDYVVQLEDGKEQVGFKVEIIDSGESFLQRVKEQKPHILLLDNKLPGIQGIEILKQLSDGNISILTIMITAYATFDKAVLATKLGAYDFLAKPFTPDELRYAVRKACRTLLLTERASDLEEARRRVRFEFISVLAHELKAPLNAVEGYADMMISRSSGETISDYDHVLERIKFRTGAMRKMIVDLLDLTSIESGQRRRNLETVNLGEVVLSVVESCRQLAQERDITVKTNISKDPVYTADRNEMEMLICNLLTNSIKYNRDGGLVTVTVLQEEMAFLILVTDTGIGMSAVEQEKLFKEFSRIKNAKTRSISGSGLGLSIIKKIVDLYGGEIRVESTVDVGSTFTVRLPSQ